jgi:hypothetical protein
MYLPCIELQNLADLMIFENAPDLSRLVTSWI